MYADFNDVSDSLDYNYTFNLIAVNVYKKSKFYYHGIFDNLYLRMSAKRDTVCLACDSFCSLPIKAHISCM